MTGVGNALLKSAVDLVKAAVDLVKTAVDQVKTSTDAVNTNITTLRSNLSHSTLKRTALTTFLGASFAEVANTTTTIVSSGTNVNGIVLRHAHLSVRGAGTGYIRAGGNDILRCNNTTSNGYASTVTDLFIPAGMALEANTNSADSYAIIWYEVL